MFTMIDDATSIPEPAPIMREVSKIAAAIILASAIAGAAGCASNRQAEQAQAQAARAELSAQRAEAAAAKAQKAAEDANAAADHARKAVDEATREINRVSDHIDQLISEQEDSEEK
jgi:hypothetical protein